MALPYTRAEIKDRARSEWLGLCNVTLPSFNEDFSGLDEDGIRHDVELAAAYGYWGTLVASESGTRSTWLWLSFGCKRPCSHSMNKTPASVAP